MLRSVVLSLLLLTGCAAAPAPTPFEVPRWSPHDPGELPPALASLYVLDAAGWDGGLLVAGEYAAPALFTSPDGHAWTARAPEGFSLFLRGRSVAAHASAAYVLGGSRDEVVVWRTEDGERWERSPLPDSARDDPFMTIAAGPRGVVVIGYDHPAMGLGATDDPDGFQGFRVWHAEDGRSFGQAVTIADDEPAGVLPRLTATQDGFLLHDSDLGLSDGTPLFRSADGTTWTYIGDGLPQGYRDATGRIGSLTFVLGRDADGLHARYRRDDEPGWSAGSIDLGRLPDAGVTDRDHQWAVDAHPWGRGALAIGRTDDGAAGLVWTSPDGITWTRMPVRDHGFDRLAEVPAVASTRDRTFLFGVVDSPPNQELRLWSAPLRG
ncbi:hypothetical protein ACWEFJ_14845 [Actinosynnema sp. NPDC004786]